VSPLLWGRRCAALQTLGGTPVTTHLPPRSSTSPRKLSRRVLVRLEVTVPCVDNPGVNRKHMALLLVSGGREARFVVNRNRIASGQVTLSEKISTGSNDDSRSVVNPLVRLRRKSQVVEFALMGKARHLLHCQLAGSRSSGVFGTTFFGNWAWTEII